MIKDAAKECGIETELPKEFIDALMESHVEARDAYAEKAVEGAQKSSESVDVKESEEYKALEKEYNDYKSEQEGKESQAAKEAAARAFFESRSIKDANLKLAMRSSAAEIAALELGFAHQQPGVFEEGVKLLAVEIGLEFVGTLLACANHRAPFDGVKLDGFLAFGDGGFEVSAAQGTRSFVAHSKERNQLCKVVLVAILLGDAPFFIGFASVVVGVVAGSE
jgi:hypothetical protein